MWVDFANAIDLRCHFDVLKTCTNKCTLPILCSQKAWIWANLWISPDVYETLKNLKHQLGIDWLIEMGAQAFADHEPTIAGQNGARFIQGKQEILGDMHHVNGVYQIEFPWVDAL